MSKVNRRNFLKHSSLFATAACCSAAWGGPFAGRKAYAQSNGGNGRTLVFINQFGGNDHLNSFTVPHTLGAYYDRRPSLAIPSENILDIGNNLGFNPILSGMHSLYNEQNVAIIQGVGDPVGNRSHFTSQEYMSRGITDTSNLDKRGWIGRLGDLYFNDLAFNTIGLGVGAQTDFNSSRSQNLPVVTLNLDQLQLPEYTNENRYRNQIAAALAKQEATVALSPRVQDARRGLRTFYDSLGTINQVRDEYSGSATYPDNNFGVFLNDAAKLIQSNLVNTQVIYGGIGGWDTHGSQTPSHTALLTRVDQSIAAFAQDLKAMNKWDSTTICIFTEFGRVNFENGSGGTDHAKACAFVLIGGGVRGGIYGNNPTNNQIANQEFLDMEIDFRNVFAQTIQWLGLNPDPVFPENYDRTALNLFT